MPERRVVRVAESFFDQLDQQLGSERGPSGEPSSTDFLVLELPPVVELFATGFERLPHELSGVGAVRVLIASGVVVRTFAVYGVLTDEGAIELVGLTIER